MLLRLHKVAKLYGPKLVFKGISLELPAGRTMLIAGPNGAGKSTLLRLVAGLERPSSGDVQCQAPPGALGYLGHATFVYPQLSALENLGFWSRYNGRKADKDVLLAALERVELAHVARERAGCFSRGMAQRLNLARVFLLEPQLLLLDEPATGLDQRSRGILAREVRAARERGAAVLWVSHSLEQDLPLADQVLALAEGRCVYLGPAADYRFETPGCAPTPVPPSNAVGACP